jgi:hypothetical protein
MSPPPPPPPPPALWLPSFTRKKKKKKKQLDEHPDEKSASSHPSGLHSRSSRGSRGSRSSLPASQRPSQARSPPARFASYSPTATLTDAQSKSETTSGSRAEKLTFVEDRESYNILPGMAPKPGRSRTKLSRGGIFRCNFGWGWGLCFGRKDKDKDYFITEKDRLSSETTILPVYPRGEHPLSFAPDDAQTPTRRMSHRSKTSYALKQRKDSQASRATKSSNLSGGSKWSNNSRSDSVNTLATSALERKKTHRDIRGPRDTTTQLAELRQLMAKDNLDY